MRRRITCRASAADAGERLDRFLARALPAIGEDVSRRRLRRAIADGAVYVDGHRIRVASRPIRRSSTVEVWLTTQERSAVPALDPGRVLYEDAALIAVDKPSGLPVQATVDDAVGHLEAAVAVLLRERDGEVPFLGLPHRLDRGTSGVVVLARSRPALAAVAAAFAAGRVRKVYQALAAAPSSVEVPPAWTVDRPLAREGRRTVQAADGRPAVTDFRLLDRRPGVARLEAVPRTGRTHQIRVHLASSGLPVLGDRLYGPPSTARRLLLHAWRLELPHPSTGEPLQLESPLPEDFRP